MPAEIMGDQARALGLPTGDAPQPELSGVQASDLGLPANTPIPQTSIQLREPDDPQYADHGPSKPYNIHDFLDNRIQAGLNATSTPANEARRQLNVARDMGADPVLLNGANDAVTQYEKQSKKDQLDWKLSMLPRVAAWMAQGKQYAAAIQGEVDQWGTLDWLFGKLEQPAALGLPQGGPWEQAQAQRPEFAPGASRTLPGWITAFGKQAYGMTTSIQTMAQMAWGDGKNAKPLAQLQQERDVASQPAPGDSNRTPWLRRANSVIGMAPLIAAGEIHPAAAFGLMYTESVGRNYEDFRLQGYTHEEARDIATVVGSVSASIGSALGPWSRNKVLPQATAGSLAYLSNALVGAALRRPGAWSVVKDLGLNFLASHAMNIAMASSEASIKEAFDSAKSGRTFDGSKVASAAGQAADSWVEMAALSVAPAYSAHRERMARYEAQPQAVPPTPQEVKNQSIYDNYEQRGQALRSLHAASEISTAVQAVKDSEFMKSNPEDARDLITKLVAPRASQTVFIDPKAFTGMNEDARAQLGSPDLSQGRAGNIPANLVDLLMHPDAEKLLPHVAGGPDLLTLQQATGVDLTSPISVHGLDIPDAQLDAHLAQEAARRRAERENTAPLPTAAEVHTATQNAMGREPAPVIPPEERPVPARQAKGWADDAMSRVPSGELQDRAAAHEGRAADATRVALSAPADATGPSPEAQAARVRADANTVLRDAARRAIKEVTTLGQGIAEMSGSKPRAAAYRAGWDLGQAHDALTEMLGSSAKRGYAAPDLSDVRDRLLREDKLSQDFDIGTVNKLLQQANPIENLSVSELREVHKALEQITSAADAENTILDNGVRVAKGMILQGVAEHLAKIPDLPPGQNSTAQEPRGVLQKLGAGKAKAAAMINAPHTLFFKMGPIGDDLWFHGLVGGVSKEERLWGGAESKLREIEDAVPDKLRATGDDPIPAFGPHAQQWGMRTRSEAWRMALHLGTQGADVHIAKAMDITPMEIHDWVQQNLGRTPEDAKAVMKNLVEPHWPIFENIYGEYEQHFKDRGLAPPEKLKTQQYTVAGQTYSGGYGGKLKWRNLSTGETPGNPASLEALLDNSPTSSPEPDTGHLESRAEGVQGVPDLSWDGVGQSMRKEIHDIALRPFVEDAYKIFSDGKIRQLLADKMGKQALNEIYDPSGKTSFLHVVARGSVADVHTARWFTQLTMNLQGRAAYSAFSGNLRVLGAQASHLVAAMPALGISPDHAAMGVQAALNPDRRAWAMQESPVLQLRDTDYQRRAEDLNREMTGVEPGDNAISRNTDNLNWAAWHEMDGFLSHAIWEMKYAQQTAQWRTGGGVSHQEAVRAADKAVTLMMPAQDTYDQSSFVRDRSVAGFSFLTRNFQGTLANLSAMNWWEARVSGKTLAKPMAAAKFVGMVMAAEVLGKGVLMQGGPKENQSPESWAAERTASVLFYPYMLADPAAAAYHVATGDRRAALQDMAHLMPPSMQVVSSGIGDIGTLVQKGDTDAGMRAGAHLMGLILKTPLPGKAFDAYNAASNSDSPADAGKKALGYR